MTPRRHLVALVIDTIGTAFALVALYSILVRF